MSVELCVFQCHMILSTGFKGHLKMTYTMSDSSIISSSRFV